jgi:hypothetical protein
MGSFQLVKIEHVIVKRSGSIECLVFSMTRAALLNLQKKRLKGAKTKLGRREECKYVYKERRSQYRASW